MSLRYISTSTAPTPGGPYSQAIEVEGILYCSGQIPVDPETGQMVEGGIVEQATRVFKNLSNVLSAGGSSMNYILKTTVYLADLDDFKAMNEVFEKAFANHKPARSTIQVAGLPLGALIEIDAVAQVIR